MIRACLTDLQQWLHSSLCHEALYSSHLTGSITQLYWGFQPQFNQQKAILKLQFINGSDNGVKNGVICKKLLGWHFQFACLSKLPVIACVKCSQQRSCLTGVNCTSWAVTYTFTPTKFIQCNNSQWPLQRETLPIWLVIQQHSDELWNQLSLAWSC
jgi:hypothetical protein